MPNGFGRGGWGFGFRGSSPPWPYVGRGRGGLPRCGYFLSGAAGMPPPQGYPSPAAVPYGADPYAEGVPYGGAPMVAGPYAPGIPYGGAPMGADPYAPQMTQEQELDFLRSQAEAIRGQLEQIDVRIKELEPEKKRR